MEKVHRHWCNTLILPMTADRTDGLCLPCSREVVKNWKAQPTRKAYKLAALVLLCNGITASLLLYVSGVVSPAIVSGVVDLALAVFLLKQDIWARTIVLMRAALGVLVVPVLIGMSGSPWVFESIFAQLLFCGSLIILLMRDTKKWYLAVGGSVGMLYLLFVFLMIIWVINA